MLVTNMSRTALSGLPLVLHDALQAISASLHLTRIVLLCRLDRTVTKQLCYVLQRHSIYEQFNRERVPEHMWVTPLGCAVSVFDLRQIEQPPQCSLPIGHGTLRVSIATPKKVSRVRARPCWNIPQRMGDYWIERQHDRHASFGAAKHQPVVISQP